MKGRMGTLIDLVGQPRSLQRMKLTQIEDRWQELETENERLRAEIEGLNAEIANGDFDHAGLLLDRDGLQARFDALLQALQTYIDGYHDGKSDHILIVPLEEALREARK